MRLSGFWKRPILYLVIAALAMAVAGIACGDDATSTPRSAVQEEPDEGAMKLGGTLKVGMIASNVTMDPPLVAALSDLSIVQHAYDTLVMRNPDLSHQPMLAESWGANADSTVWTFNLREGVKFRHGKEFKAEDVVFTFDRLFEVESALKATFPEDMKVVAVDDYTVEFQFSEAYAPLLDSIVKYHALITPSDVDPARFATETLGTGPFYVTEHVVGERTVLKKNPDYWWEGHPLVDDMIFVYLPDPTARGEALKAGTVDVIYDLDTALVPTLRDHPDTLVAQAPTGGYMLLAMDTTVAPFDNKLVRQALQAATDRDAILQGAQLGVGGIAYDHPITPTDPFFNAACTPPAYNIELAKDLLAQAGYADGLDVTLYTATAGASMVEMATIMKEKAAPAGININIEVVSEDGFWVDVWLVKPFSTAWYGGRPPHEALSIVYPTGAAWNDSHLSNPEVDRLIKEGASSADPAVRKQAYGELQCLLIDEVPRIVPVFQPGLLGLRNDVRGIEPMWDKMLQVHRTWLDR